MERELAIEICRHWQRPRAWYNLFNIRKKQLDIVSEIAGSKIEDLQARLQRCSEWRKRHTDLLDALRDWVRQNRPDLIGELPVLDWAATEREHIQGYCKSMQRVEAGILSVSDPWSIGRSKADWLELRFMTKDQWDAMRKENSGRIQNVPGNQRCGQFKKTLCEERGFHCPEFAEK